MPRAERGAQHTFPRHPALSSNLCELTALFLNMQTEAKKKKIASQSLYEGKVRLIGGELLV